MTDPQAPLLEMLWEANEPTGVLEARFGFSNSGAAIGWVLSTMAEHWGIRVDSCERIVMSDSNALAWVGTSSGRMIAKWSVATERFPRLAASARLTAWLEGQGLPVSAPVATLSGRLQVEVNGVSLCLQHEIEGHPLDITNPEQVRAAGATLARLHDAMASYPEADRVPANVSPSEPLAARITRWLESSPAHVPVTARDALRGLVTDAPPSAPPVQLVHGDFRSANVLCVGRDVAGVIDFEEARLDHRIVEVARSAVLLGTRFHDWGPVSPEVRSQFLGGYQSARPLTRDERAWWDVLVFWTSLDMTPSAEDPTGWVAAALTHLQELGPDL